MADDLLNGNSPRPDAGVQDQDTTNVEGATEKSPLESAMETAPEEPKAPDAGPLGAGDPAPISDMPPPPADPISPSPVEPSPPADPVVPPPIEPSSFAPEPPAPPAEPTPPVSPEANLPAGEPETTPAPDTDEFLKSILDENSQGAPANELAPMSEPAPASEPVSLGEPPVSAPSEPPVSGEPPILPPPPPAPPLETPPEPQPSPDQSFSQFSNMPAEVQPEPSVNPIDVNQPSGGGTLDGISNAPAPTESNGMATEELPKKSGGGTKLIILVIVAAILVIGGYLAYTNFFSAKSTPTDTSLTSQTATSELTNDQVRKSALQNLQGKLLNLYAADGTYPVAATLVYVDTPGNVVEKALVPTYVDKMPADPDVTKHYGYKSDGKTFTLTASLDDTTDPEAVVEGGLTLYKVTEATKFTTASTETSPTSSASDNSFDNSVGADGANSSL